MEGLASTLDAQLEVVLDVTEPTPYLEARARFIRFGSIDAATAHALAGATPPRLELETCVLRDASAEVEMALARLPERRVLHHLDAGEIHFQIDGLESWTVTPRHVAPMFPQVMGVEYDEIAVPIAVSEGTAVTVVGEGGAHIGALDAYGDLPPITRPHASLAGDGLVVRWEPARNSAAVIASDEELVVSVQGPTPGVTLRCRTQDTGRLLVPRAHLTQLLAEDTSSLAVILERTRRFPLAAPGIEQGRLAVTTRSVVQATAPTSK